MGIFDQPLSNLDKTFWAVESLWLKSSEHIRSYFKNSKLGQGSTLDRLCYQVLRNWKLFSSSQYLKFYGQNFGKSSLPKRNLDSKIWHKKSESTEMRNFSRIWEDIFAVAFLVKIRSRMRSKERSHIHTCVWKKNIQTWVHKDKYALSLWRDALKLAFLEGGNAVFGCGLDLFQNNCTFSECHPRCVTLKVHFLHLIYCIGETRWIVHCILQNCN